MKKILTACVSIFLSLSFLIPLQFIKPLEVFALSDFPQDPCTGYELLTDAQKNKLSSLISSYKFVFYNSGWAAIFYSNGTVTGTITDADITGTIYYIDKNGTQYTWYQNYMNGTDFTNDNFSIFRYTSTSSDDQIANNYTFSTSACVVNTYTISVIASTGGSVSGGGSYTSKQTVILTATPDEGYRFVQWSDGSTENPRSFVPTSDLSLTAEFEEIPYYDISLNILGNGQVLGSGTYEGGTVVEIEAIPGTHYNFSMWSDGNTDNPRTLTLNENITLTAVFLEDPKYEVNVEIFGNGTVTGIGSYYGGTEVLLSAIPDEGYYFQSWNDGSIDPTKTITVTEDVTFAATFKEKSTAACTYSKDLVANPYVLKGVERAIKLVESNQIENYWWIYKRIYSFYLDIDGGYVPNGTSFVQPQSIEWVLAYVVDDQWVYDSLGFEMNVPGYFSWVYYYEDGSEVYHTLKLDAGNDTGAERIDAEGNITSFDLISTYDDITLLDAQCWQQGYDSNYYDLLQYYELKNANSNLSNNNAELKDINSNLTLIDRSINFIHDAIDGVEAGLDILNSNVLSIFHKLDDVISGLFGIEDAVEGTNELLNQQIGLDQQQNNLIESGTSTSQSAADTNDSVTSELTGSITQHNDIEKEYQAQMQEHISNVDFEIDLGGVSNFTSTATFISSSMDTFFNLDPAIKLFFTFPLICGLAMLIIGRLKS